MTGIDIHKETQLSGKVDKFYMIVSLLVKGQKAS